MFVLNVMNIKYSPKHLNVAVYKHCNLNIKTVSAVEGVIYLNVHLQRSHNHNVCEGYWHA